MKIIFILCNDSVFLISCQYLNGNFCQVIIQYSHRNGTFKILDYLFGDNFLRLVYNLSQNCGDASQVLSCVPWRQAHQMNQGRLLRYLYR